jgi:hypothetical protein
MSRTSGAMRTLLNRLFWPTPDIASASCQATALLLENTATHETASEEFLRWLSSQDSEYRTALGLLPILYARQVLDVKPDRLPTPGRLQSAMKSPSPLSQAYLRAMSAQDLVLEVYSPGFIDDALLPKIDLSEFSTTMVHDDGVPGVFLSVMDEISRRTHRNFIQHIAAEWEHLMNMPAHQNLDPRPDIVWDLRDGYVPIVTRRTEVYMSAFLRTLSWLVHVGVLDQLASESYSALVSPVILGFWKTQPQCRPSWWPWFDQVQDPSDLIDSVRDKVSSLSKQDYGFGGQSPILRASGRIGAGENPVDLDMVGCLVAKTQLAPATTDASLFQQIAEDSLWKVWSLDMSSVVLSSSAESDKRLTQTPPFLPLTASFRFYLRGNWHWRSLLRGVYAPSAVVSSRPSIACGLEAVTFDWGDSCHASWSCWNQELSAACPRLSSGDWNFVAPSNGSILLATRSTLDAITSNTGMQLAWLCRMRSYSRENAHEPYRVSDDFFTVTEHE